MFTRLLRDFDKLKGYLPTSAPGLIMRRRRLKTLPLEDVFPVIIQGQSFRLEPEGQVESMPSNLD